MPQHVSCVKVRLSSSLWFLFHCGLQLVPKIQEESNPLLSRLS